MQGSQSAEIQARPERIDSHHHLWKYSSDDYPWMLEGMESIRRDFLIDDLRTAMREGLIDGVVTVQARQKLEETEWLLSLASQHEFMRAVVGWVPLADPAIADILDKYASDSKLRGVRHVVHDEPDDEFILRDDFNRGIHHLRRFGLRYDILIFERHLPQTIAFVDRHPNQIFIVDHIAKPRIKDELIAPWRDNLIELAKRENVYCKLSGVVTEANWQSWTEGGVRPYMDAVLQAFGPHRVMFGSDWPVCLVACRYGRWVDVVTRAVEGYSSSEKQAIFGGTAKKAYRW